MSNDPVQLALFEFTTEAPKPKVKAFFQIFFISETGNKYYLRQVGLHKDWDWIDEKQIDGKNIRPYRAWSVNTINRIHYGLLNGLAKPSPYPKHTPEIEVINFTED